MLGPYELNEVYTGDALVLARSIPDESVDIVFTSPPYNVGMAYETTDDSMSEADFWRFQECWLVDAFRVTVGGGRLYATVGDEMMWEFRPLAERVGWRFHQLLVWCKPNLPGRKITRDWDGLTECCLLFHKERRTSMVNGPFGVTTHNWVVEAAAQSNFHGWQKKVHPAQMPVRVAYCWLSRTPGQVVYDPFLGSGTTAQAARMLGKDWIAFEIGPETADLARERIRCTKVPLPELGTGWEQLAFADDALQGGAG